MKKRNVSNTKLDEYEQELSDALDQAMGKGKLKNVPNLEEEMALAKRAAANYLRKDAKINIRLTRHDVDGLRRIAVREGLPYQTLIASILHKYVTNHLEK